MKIVNGRWFRNEEGQLQMVWVCRNKDGQKGYLKMKSDVKPYFYIKKSDLPLLKDNEKRSLEVAEKQEHGEYSKYIWKYPSDVKDFRDLLSSEVEIRGLKICHEADIPFVRRYNIDKELFLFISEDGNPIEKEDIKYRYAYIDIETDDTEGKGLQDLESLRILSIGVITDDGKEYFISNKNESEILKEFYKVIHDYDVLLAWNGENFDYPVIISATRRHLLDREIDTRYWEWIDLMILYKKIRFKIPQSYSLDNIGLVELNLRKIDRTESIRWLFENKLDGLKEYNMRDCEIMQKLDEKLKITVLFELLCEMTGLFMSDAHFNSRVVDMLILRKFKEAGMVLPSKYPRDTTKFKGATVLKPVIGRHSKVLCIDFTSLYNRIIQTFNISNETYEGFYSATQFESIRRKKKKNQLLTPFQTGFKIKPVGIIPGILIHFEEMRNKYKKMMKDSKYGSPEYVKNDLYQKTVKTILLSFYGFIGMSTARCYMKEIAGTITGAGRYFIEETRKYVEEHGYKVLYGDTDSIFLQRESFDVPDDKSSLINYIIKAEDNHMVTSRTLEESKEYYNSFEIEDLQELYGGYKICDMLNFFYSELLYRFNVPKEYHKIEMKFEKIYSSLIFTIGGSGEGAKKRYTGYMNWKEGYSVPEDKQFHATGIEIVRSDWCEFAKYIQKGVISALLLDNMDEEGIRMYLDSNRKGLFSGDFDNMLIISKGLTRSPDHYKTEPLHAKIARTIKDKSLFLGMRILYIITGRSEGKLIGVYVQDEDNPLRDVTDLKTCYQYYWKKQALAPALRIINSVYPTFNVSNFSTAKYETKGDCKPLSLKTPGQYSLSDIFCKNEVVI